MNASFTLRKYTKQLAKEHQNISKTSNKKTEIFSALENELHVARAILDNLVSQNVFNKQQEKKIRKKIIILEKIIQRKKTA